MKNLKRLGAAVVLTCVLGLSAFSLARRNHHPVRHLNRVKQIRHPAPVVRWQAITPG